VKGYCLGQNFLFGFCSFISKTCIEPL